MKKSEKIYSGVNSLPRGRASDHVTPGCIVLEGGAWRGIYTQGALDALMEDDINFETTIGVSAGAMSGIAYLSGQIGYSGRLNLTYRHDPNYCGAGAMRRDHGVTGFRYFYHTLLRRADMPLDFRRFRETKRRFVVVATNVETGEPTYFEKGSCSIFRAVQASATVPYVSRPVVIDGIPYLDGGCSVKIPYDWAVRQDFRKIMVIRTQDRTYTKEPKKENAADRFLYHNYPAFVRAMEHASTSYNEILSRMEQDEKDGKIFVLAPAELVGISRFEGDMEKLGALYWRGYHEMKKQLPELRAYLAAPESAPQT